MCQQKFKLNLNQFGFQLAETRDCRTFSHHNQQQHTTNTIENWDSVREWESESERERLRKFSHTTALHLIYSTVVFWCKLICEPGSNGQANWLIQWCVFECLMFSWHPSLSRHNLDRIQHSHIKYVFVRVSVSLSEECFGFAWLGNHCRAFSFVLYSKSKEIIIWSGRNVQNQTSNTCFPMPVN